MTTRKYDWELDAAETLDRLDEVLERIADQAEAIESAIGGLTGVIYRRGESWLEDPWRQPIGEADRANEAVDALVFQAYGLVGQARFHALGSERYGRPRPCHVGPLHEEDAS